MSEIKILEGKVLTDGEFSEELTGICFATEGDEPTAGVVLSPEGEAIYSGAFPVTKIRPDGEHKKLVRSILVEPEAKDEMKQFIVDNFHGFYEEQVMMFRDECKEIKSKKPYCKNFVFWNGIDKISAKTLNDFKYMDRTEKIHKSLIKKKIGSMSNNVFEDEGNLPNIYKYAYLLECKQVILVIQPNIFGRAYFNIINSNLFLLEKCLKENPQIIYVNGELRSVELSDLFDEIEIKIPITEEKARRMVNNAVKSLQNDEKHRKHLDTFKTNLPEGVLKNGR